MTKTTAAEPESRPIYLSMLRFGHDPLAGPVINARSSGRLDRIDEMEVDLREHGQIYPLLVVENPGNNKSAGGLFFVFGGNRRLAALQRIHKGAEGQVTIPCRVFPRTAAAWELSLAENNALPLHPVERFRGFAELLRRNPKISAAEAPAEIARRFGLTIDDARRALALGQLDEAVLDAWREGKITAEAARVFTLCPTKEDQRRILLDALKGQHWRRSPDHLRERIVGKKQDVWPAVRFVGVDAYRAAGGKLDEDLFQERHVVHHPAIAVKLMNEKLDAARDALVADGWLWAARADQMDGGNWRHGMSGWSRLPAPKTPPMNDHERSRRDELRAAVDEAARGDDYDAEVDAQDDLRAFEATLAARGYAPAARKKAGCVVEVSRTGELVVHAGVVRPDEARAKKKAKLREAARRAGVDLDSLQGEDRGPPAIPASLAVRLSEGFTRACADAVLAAGDETVLRIAVAALETASDVVNLTHSGLGSDDLRDGGADFAAALKRLARCPLDDLISKLAVFVGASMRMTNASPTRRPGDPGDEPDVAALAALLPPKELQAALLTKRIDLEDYFESAPAALALEALAEMRVDPPPGAGKVKKAALVQHVLQHARRARWLPPQVRVPGYEGPGSVLPKKEKAKPTKAKPRR